MLNALEMRSGSESTTAVMRTSTFPRENLSPGFKPVFNRKEGSTTAPSCVNSSANGFSGLFLNSP